MTANRPYANNWLLIFGMTIAVCLLSFSSQAQTVIWQLQPASYTSMARFGSGLYRVEQGGKVGLIRSDGAVVVPVAADRIGGFYEGLALVTKGNRPSEQVLGILSDDGHYTPLPAGKKYFTLDGQEFFSSGALSVVDADGKKGYIDRQGNVLCGFDRNYHRVKPFTDGFAAVSEQPGKFYLIDKQGQQIRLSLPDAVVGSVIDKVYNPVGGKVLLLDDRGNAYKFTLATSQCEGFGKKYKGQGPKCDYLFRPKEVLDVAGIKVLDDAPFESLPGGAVGLSPISEGNKYGFATGGKTLLPCQLDEATPFEDNLSVVQMGGKRGLLRYVVDAGTFSITSTSDPIAFNAGESVTCRFSLQTPTPWGDKHMELVLTDKATEQVPQLTEKDGSYSFVLSPKKSEQRQYDVRVSSEGLLLWTGSLAYTLKKRIVDLVIQSLVFDSKVTDPEYKVTGSFIVVNPNDEEMTTDISLSHSDMIKEVGGYPKSITLNGGESRKVTFFFITDNAPGAWNHSITVTSSKGGRQSLSAEIETF